MGQVKATMQDSVKEKLEALEVDDTRFRGLLTLNRVKKDQMYQGTVSAATEKKRRNKNKLARKARKVNR